MKMNSILREIVLVLVLTVLHSSQGEISSSTDQDNTTKDDGRIVQSLFRFPASQLGPQFNELLQSWYIDWFHVSPARASNSTSSNYDGQPPIIPEPAGVTHAFHSVSTPAATLFRRQCYAPSPVNKKLSNPQLHNLYRNFEQRRKELSFQYMEDAQEERRLMHTMTKRFFPAFLPEDEKKGGSDSARRMHKKKATSTINTVYSQTTLPSDIDAPSKLSFTTVSTENNNTQYKKIQQWHWYPPALFSSRRTPRNMPFRVKLQKAMRTKLSQAMLQQQSKDPNFDSTMRYLIGMGRPSGMFWYPPGGVREWHSNYLDLVGDGSKEAEEIFSSQTWRMYFVRTVRDPQFDKKLARLKKKNIDDIDQSNNDHSAMHIIPGHDAAGINLDVLKKAGARKLTEEEKMRQYNDEFAEEYAIPPGSDSANSKGDTMDSATPILLDRNSVWRIPDQDGYVTLFRIPDIWHCIVSEEVHRYSLGFAFSDREVQGLLMLAGIDYDLGAAGGDDRSKGIDDGDIHENDEL